jgi:hypothetical protein
LELNFVIIFCRKKFNEGMIVVSSHNVFVNKLSVDIYDISMTFDLAKRFNNEKYGSLQQRSFFSSTVPYRGKKPPYEKALRV